MTKWLSLPGNDQWLIIYDNVDNPEIPDNKRTNAYNIQSYFPEAYQGSIIVTTRWKTLMIGHLQEVGKLSQTEESIALLEKMSGRMGIREGELSINLVLRADAYFENRAGYWGFAKETGWSSTGLSNRWRSFRSDFYAYIGVSSPLWYIVARASTDKSQTAVLRGSDAILNLESFIYIYTERRWSCSQAPWTMGILWQSRSLVWVIGGWKKWWVSCMVPEYHPNQVSFHVGNSQTAEACSDWKVDRIRRIFNAQLRTFLDEDCPMDGYWKIKTCVSTYLCRRDYNSNPSTRRLENKTTFTTTCWKMLTAAAFMEKIRQRFWWTRNLCPEIFTQPRYSLQRSRQARRGRVNISTGFNWLWKGPWTRSHLYNRRSWLPR